MKLTTLRSNLHQSLIQASKFTSQKAQLPILANILFSAEKTHLKISSTNLETSFTTTIGARVASNGSISIPAHTITDMISNLSSQQVELEAVKETLKISSNGFSANLTGMNTSDFPEIPQTTGPSPVSIKTDNFKEALSQVLFAVSRDETRPTLTGVLLIIKPANLILVSSDGFRLSQKTLAFKSSSPSKKFIIPRLTLSELQKLSLGDDSDILLSHNKKENQLVFGLKNTILATRLIEGSFPDFEKIIPKSHSTKISLGKEELLKAVKLASVLARQSSNTIKFHIKKDSLTIFSESSSGGDQKSSLPAKVDGGEVEISFNYRFIEEFLNVISGEEVVIELNNSTSPGVFKDPKDPDFLHLIMPVKA